MTAKRISLSLTALFLFIAMCLSLSACGGNTTQKLNDFIDSMEDELDATRALYGETLDIKLSAKDKSLIYTFQYKIDTGMDNDELAKGLDAALDESAMTKMFTDLLKAVRDEVADAESVIVEYRDKDNKLITSKEFK